MTPIEFSAWINGINAALLGANPPKALWALIVQEAAKVAHPRSTILPPPEPLEIQPRDWWTKPHHPTDAVPPWTVTCGPNAVDTAGQEFK